MSERKSLSVPVSAKLVLCEMCGRVRGRVRGREGDQGDEDDEGDEGEVVVGLHLASVTLTIRSDHTDVRSKREDPPSSPRRELIRRGRIITCDASHAVLPARLRAAAAAGSMSSSGGDAAAGNV